jgi:galactokinase
VTDDPGARFAAAFGRAPQTVWAAPGRVNVIGEHTDYNDGFSLPIALPMVTTAAVAARDDDRLGLASAQRPGEIVEVDRAELAPGSVEGWAAYVAGAVWALGQAGHTVGAFDILIDGAVPEGSGLSSSAALECAVVGALAQLAGLDISRPDLARVARHIENDFVGAPTGIMDQMASLLCEEHHALLLDARSLDVTQVPFGLVAEGLSLLVIDTRAPHTHVDSEYAARRRTCEEAARILGVPALRDVPQEALEGHGLDRLDPVARRRVRHVVTENARVLRTVELLEHGRVREIGPLLTASHASLRDDYEVSVPELDVAVDAALRAGVYGARMTGGGFGGSAIALADTDRLGRVQTAVEAAYADHSFTAPRFFPAVPSAGARRTV